MTRLKRTRQDKISSDKTGQDKAGQDKTKQSKPIQAKLRQEDKTRQDKTKQDTACLKQMFEFSSWPFHCSVMRSDSPVQLKRISLFGITIVVAVWKNEFLISTGERFSRMEVLAFFPRFLKKFCKARLHCCPALPDDKTMQGKTT
jgi:hypothetical protein